MSSNFITLWVVILCWILGSHSKFVRSVKTSIWNTIFGNARHAYEREGLGYILLLGLKMALDVPKNHFFFWYYKTFRSSDTFEFQGNTYHYLIHPYCTSWKNERAVIIPIIWKLVKTSLSQGKRILEVGNTLSYVYPVSHDILDKYEVTDGVINEDVVIYRPNKLYDLIFSVVSMQCIGWDEIPREPRKILPALENLVNLLAPGGQIIVFLGLGYNYEMDKLLRNGILKFDKQYYLKRISNLKWKEVNWEEVNDVSYDESIPTCIGIVLGIYSRTE